MEDRNKKEVEKWNKAISEVLGELNKNLPENNKIKGFKFVYSEDEK